jgi:hypothetical protein
MSSQVNQIRYEQEKWKSDYYLAIMKCQEKYLGLCIQMEGRDFGFGPVSFKDLVKFLDEFNYEVPLMKLNRWLGYVQGVLIERGVTTVEIERDETRPLFKPLDTKLI